MNEYFNPDELAADLWDMWGDQYPTDEEIRLMASEMESE